MNYHLIRTDDMLNGSGLRCTVFLSACDHYCTGCHNPETWSEKSGELFDINAFNEVLSELDKDYISGLSLSGGDPLNRANVDDVLTLIAQVKVRYPNKNIWLYTGFVWDEILKDNKMRQIVEFCDVVVDGKFIKELADENYPWAGSRNQRVIDVKKTLEQGRVVLYCD